MDLAVLIGGAVASAVTSFVLALGLHLSAMAALRRALVVTAGWILGYSVPAAIVGPDPSVLGDYRPLVIIALLLVLVVVAMLGRRRARAKEAAAAAH